MGTITKALSLLNYFSVQRPEIGLTEFARLAGRDKATVHRHLVELVQNGYLEQDSDSRNYRLGPALLRLANVRERTFPARSAVVPIVNALSRELSELVHVSLLQGNMVSPLYHADKMFHGTRVHFDEAGMLPLHATSSGLVMLAFGPGELLRQTLERPLQKYAVKTLESKADLKAAVQKTRENGFCFSDQSFEDEVCSFAVPVFDHLQTAVGALAVALPVSRLNAEKQQSIIAALRKGKAEVSAVFGGHVPENLDGKQTDAA
ncbi:MAG: IclR family transcriptional regulator [Rhodobacteraceae bacterium]|nr:IclR family transcriptional regulator [Paracoccaceae bacterium]